MSPSGVSQRRSCTRRTTGSTPTDDSCMCFRWHEDPLARSNLALVRRRSQVAVELHDHRHRASSSSSCWSRKLPSGKWPCAGGSGLQRFSPQTAADSHHSAASTYYSLPQSGVRVVIGRGQGRGHRPWYYTEPERDGGEESGSTATDPSRWSMVSLNWEGGGRAGDGRRGGQGAYAWWCWGRHLNWGLGKQRYSTMRCSLKEMIVACVV
ncbi:hypothetical protein F4808DRAFT_415360 [Astrocystis sublimbata]|nr:hypothetical protein F4808DRAFT_415360 [Astrocystis sublimbata]